MARPVSAHTMCRNTVHCNVCFRCVLGCLQADKGALCALWVTALIKVLDPDSGSCPHFRMHALLALTVACYIYTGHIVPESQRVPFLVVLT
jgi:hypothetical protein